MVFTASLAVISVASVLLLASPAPRPVVRIGVTFSTTAGVAWHGRGAGFAAIADEADAIWRAHGVSVERSAGCSRTSSGTTWWAFPSTGPAG